MSKKLPSQYSEEELLELLNSSEVSEGDTEVFDYEDDIVPFLSFYKITPGDTPTSKKLIYKLYKTFSENPYPEKDFYRIVGEFVQKTPMFFYINIDNFAIAKLLYKAEEKIDKTKSLTYQKHFQWFIDKKNVQKGSNWVEGFILYYIYIDFCREQRIKPKLGTVNFHKFLKLNFKSKRLKGNRSLWFAIDEDTFNIYPESEKNVLRKARENPKKARRSKKSRNQKEKREKQK